MEQQKSLAEMLACLPPEGRHAYLDIEAVRRLVRNIRPGVDAPATIEKTGGNWRLRYHFTLPDGSRRRRGVTLPDAAAADWIRERMRQAGGARGARFGAGEFGRTAG
ncbi:MAG: hypothetical protein LBU23_13610 [Planctomycetota bacterium]|jgi:hypothetical protein|nr:hypothetical protein [Planctomycetota bacterium]